MQDVTIQSDGLILRGELFCGETSESLKRPGALLIHGWESGQDRMFGLAQDLADDGYVCLTFDLRGHGASPGDHKAFPRSDFLKDVLAAYDYLAAQDDVESGRIIAIGSSFGGYLAALLSAERDLQGIVLRVPSDYRDDDFHKPQYSQRTKTGHVEWKNRLHSPNETAALRAVHEFTGPLLVVESENDELVPGTTVQSYSHAASDPSQVTYVVMKAAPHSISRHPEFQKEFSDIVRSWGGRLK